VAYVEQMYPQFNFSFTLATNGTILKPQHLDFFIRHDFLLMLSLDGPKNVNDRYRHFKNGQGTFDRIFRNLEFVRNYNNDYFRRNVSISSVLTPPFENVADIIEFFSNPIFMEMKTGIRSALVDTKETSFIEDYKLESSTRKFPEVADKLAKRLKQVILDGNLNQLTIEKNRVYAVLIDVVLRTIKKLTAVAVPLGACHIGLRRVFVTTSGQFHVCERAGNHYPIGDLENGFDYDRIAAYYRKMDEVTENCRNCWALHYCERCWATMGNLDGFHGEIKEQFCNINKKQVETAFVMYTQLLRESPGCFKDFTP